MEEETQWVNQPSQVHVETAIKVLEVMLIKLCVDNHFILQVFILQSAHRRVDYADSVLFSWILQSNLVISPRSVRSIFLARAEVGRITGDHSVGVPVLNYTVIWL